MIEEIIQSQLDEDKKREQEREDRHSKIMKIMNTMGESVVEKGREKEREFERVLLAQQKAKEDQDVKKEQLQKLQRMKASDEVK